VARGFLRAFASVLVAGVAAAALAVPQILIVQRVVEKTRTGDPNRIIGDFVAQSLEDTGKVNPTYWSNADSGFRAMIAEKKVASAATPTVQEAFDFAAREQFEYVLVVECVANKDGGAYWARADLYKGGNRVWSDPAKPEKFDPGLEASLMTETPISGYDFDKLVSANGFRQLSVRSGSRIDMDNTLQSIANTWAQMIGTGPLDKTAAHPFVASPKVIPGPVQRLENTTPTIPKPADNSKLFADVETLLRDGHIQQAIMFLHDGIDAEPFDFSRRARLVKLLNDSGHPELAAQEAARAAVLDPGGGGFRLESARAMLTLGNLDGADSMAKEELTRNPKDADAHMIQGIVSLRRGNGADALVHLNTALATSTSGEALFYRSLAEAICGDAAGCSTDLLASQKVSPPYQADYGTMIDIVDTALPKLGDAIRAAIPSASVANPPDGTAVAVKHLLDESSALSTFCSKLEVPAYHSSSHQRRLLALKLLAQGCGELADCISQHSEDTLNDVRIDIGEAMKQYQSAKEVYAGESSQ
jgi:tetratricopeptide (TPR) repeat protein